MNEIIGFIKQLTTYLGQYNFGQKLVLLIVVPIVITVCIKILHPKKIGSVEFEEEKPRKRMFHKKAAK